MKTRFASRLLLLTAVVASLCLPARSENATQTNALPAVAQWPASFPGEGVLQNGANFRKTWAARRTIFWNHRKEDKHAVVFLGDSITQGWKSLPQDFPDYKVANRGISGDTTRGVWYRLPEDVTDLDPEAIILLIGTNDIGLGSKPEEAADNLKHIFAALKKHNSKMPVIVCKVMPSDESRQRPTDKIQKLNSLVDDLIKGDPQFTRCDTFSIFANEKGNAKKEEFPDLLHPNAAGYAKWTAALQPILTKLNVPKAH